MAFRMHTFDIENMIMPRRINQLQEALAQNFAANLTKSTPQYGSSDVMGCHIIDLSKAF